MHGATSQQAKTSCRKKSRLATSDHPQTQDSATVAEPARTATQSGLRHAAGNKRIASARRIHDPTRGVTRQARQRQQRREHIVGMNQRRCLDRGKNALPEWCGVREFLLGDCSKLFCVEAASSHPWILNSCRPSCGWLVRHLRAVCERG